MFNLPYFVCVQVFPNQPLDVWYRYKPSGDCSNGNSCYEISGSQPMFTRFQSMFHLVCVCVHMYKVLNMILYKICCSTAFQVYQVAREVRPTFPTLATDLSPVTCNWQGSFVIQWQDSHILIPFISTLPTTSKHF